MQTACLRIPCASISTAAIRFVRLNRFPKYNIHKPATNPDYSDPEYFEREAQKHDFGPDYLDKLKQLWDEREATQRDVSLKRDDLIIQHDGKYWLPDVDSTIPRLGYDKVEALKDAPESVKKIFSVAYGNRESLTEIWKHRIMNKVRENELETDSLEAQIAYKTAVIRHMSQAAFSQMPIPPKWWRQIMSDLIAQRKQELEKLRQQNEASFQRVLEKLRIAYHTPPLQEDVPLQTRKGWVENQTKVKAEAIKEQKLRAYHEQLKRQQPAFEKMKTERLAALKKEEAELRRDLEALRTNDGEILEIVGEFKGHTIGEVFENKAHAYFYMPGAVRTAENKKSS